jgi:hypothetical protein
VIWVTREREATGRYVIRLTASSGLVPTPGTVIGTVATADEALDRIRDWLKDVLTQEHE